MELVLKRKFNCFYYYRDKLSKINLSIENYEIDCERNSKKVIYKYKNSLLTLKYKFQ